MVGLIIVRDGGVSWLNEAAEAIVRAHGGDWSSSGTPHGLVTAVSAGARRTPVRWPSPTGGTRWWLVTCSALEQEDTALLYEVTDETASVDADGLNLDQGPTIARWRWARFEAMSGLGSWQ